MTKSNAQGSRPLPAKSKGHGYAVTLGLLALLVTAAGGGTFGYLWWRARPVEGQEEAALKVVQTLRSVCSSRDDLRGVCVRSARRENNKLALAGYLDREDQRDELLRQARILLENDEPLRAKYYPDGLADSSHEFQLYPIRSEHLLRLRDRVFDAAKNLSALVRLDDVYFDDQDQLHLLGVAISSGGAQVDQTKLFHLINEVAGLYLKNNAAPGGFLAKVHIDAKEFPVLMNPVSEWTKQLEAKAETKGAVMGFLKFEPDGRVHVPVLLSRENQRKPVQDFLLSRFPGQLQLRGKSVPDSLKENLQLVDCDKLPREWQVRFARSKSRLQQQTHLDRVELSYDQAKKEPIVVVWTVSCIHPSDPEKRLAQLSEMLHQETERVVGSVPFSLVVKNTVDGKGKSPAAELEALVGRDPKLEGVVIKSIRFDPMGHVEIQVALASPAQVKAVIDLAAKMESLKRFTIKQGSRKENPCEGDFQQVSLQTGEKSDKEEPKPVVEILSKLRKKLAGDPFLSAVKITMFRPVMQKDAPELDKDDGTTRRVAVLLGRSLLPIKEKNKDGKELQEVLRETLKEEFNKMEQLKKEMVEIIDVKIDAREDGTKDGKELFLWPTDPVIHTWQKEATKATLDAVLFLDAYYLENGSLQTVVLLDDKKQQNAVGDIVNEFIKSDGSKQEDPIVIPVFARIKADAPTWPQQLQKELQPSSGEDESAVFLKRSLITGLRWKYEGGKVRALLRGLGIYDLAGKTKEEKNKLLTETLKKPFLKLVAEIKANLKDALKGNSLSRVIGRPPFSDEPEVDADFIYPLDPVHVLCKQAVTEETLAGIAFADHRFDYAGEVPVLKLVGFVHDEKKQIDLIKTSIEKALRGALSKAGDKRLVRVDTTNMITLDAKIIEPLRERFANPKAPKPLRRTRLDGSLYRYQSSGEKAPLELHLIFSGVSMTSTAGDLETVRKGIESAVPGIVKKALGTPLPAKINIKGIEYSEGKNPLEILEQAVSKNPAVDGVVIRDIRFETDGSVKVDISLATAAQRKIVEDLAASLPALKMFMKPQPALKQKKEKRSEKEKEETQEISFLQESSKTSGGISDELQKKMAKDSVLKHVRLDGFSWIHRPKGLTLIVRGWSILPSAGLTDEVKRKLASQLESLSQELQTKEKDFTGLEDGEVKDVVFAESQFHFPLKNPIIALQQKTHDNEKLHGFLFTDIYYTADRQLQVDVLTADDSQKNALKDLVGTSAGMDEDSRGPAGRRKDLKINDSPHRWRSEKLSDWKSVIKTLNARLVAKPSPGKQTRIRTAYFGYQEEEKTAGVSLQLQLAGICLQPNLSKDLSTQLKDVADTVLGSLIPPYEVDSRNIRSLDPVRRLQGFVASTPTLDGVGVAEAVFDEKDRIAFRGVWREETQKDELARAARKVLDDLPFSVGHFDYALDFAVLKTHELLAGLRKWTACTLDEAWIERLFFNQDGILTISGFVSVEEDKTRVGNQLDQELAAHPQFQKRYKARDLLVNNRRKDSLHFVAFKQSDEKEKGPGIELRVRKGITGALREKLQYPRDLRTGVPPRTWDGMMLRRGFYNAKGTFALEGLCDSDAQKTALAGFLTRISQDHPFCDTVGKEICLHSVQPVSLEPMLTRLRKILPAYEACDGLTLDGACHDVDNRLVLRFFVIGEGPEETATTTLLNLIAADKRFRLRVDAKYLRVADLDPSTKGPLRLHVLTRRSQNKKLAVKLVADAISILRRSIETPDTTCCPRPDQGPSQRIRDKQPAQALRMLDVALLHSPKDATAWYLRAWCYLLLEDSLLAGRDLRRLSDLESRQKVGEDLQVRRLQLIERLQGNFRHHLEHLQKTVEKDLKSGKPPIQLTDIP